MMFWRTLFWWFPDEKWVFLHLFCVWCFLCEVVWYFLREGKLNQLFSWPGSPTVECVNLWTCLNTHTHLDVWNCFDDSVELLILSIKALWIKLSWFVQYMLAELYELIFSFHVLTLQERIPEKVIPARVKMWWTEVLDLVGLAIKL